MSLYQQDNLRKALASNARLFAMSTYFFCGLFGGIKMPIVNEGDVIVCPKCRRIAIKLIALNDNGTGERMCRRCKRKVLNKDNKEVKKAMAIKKSLKISEFSLDRLRVYAKNHEIRVFKGLDEGVGVASVKDQSNEERQFYITELLKLNDGKDEVRDGVDASKYQGVYSCVCSGCGEEKSVRPEVYAKRVEKFGSEEVLKAKYLCQECRRTSKSNLLGPQNQ